MGAWIETCPSDSQNGAAMWVAPYVGAWIETKSCRYPHEPQQSHPTWVRGLKRFLGCVLCGALGSHPTWVRGLKHNLVFCFVKIRCVAPYVGAWIETVTPSTGATCSAVAPYVGAWIETFRSCLSVNGNSRTLRGCVD